MRCPGRDGSEVVAAVVPASGFEKGGGGQDGRMGVRRWRPKAAGFGGGGRRRLSRRGMDAQAYRGSRHDACAN